jgi:hypothetical protein
LEPRRRTWLSKSRSPTSVPQRSSRASQRRRPNPGGTGRTLRSATRAANGRRLRAGAGGVEPRDLPRGRRGVLGGRRSDVVVAGARPPADAELLAHDPRRRYPTRHGRQSRPRRTHHRRLARCRYRRLAARGGGLERGWELCWMATGLTSIPACTDDRVSLTADVPEYGPEGQRLLTLARASVRASRTGTTCADPTRLKGEAPRVLARSRTPGRSGHSGRARHFRVEFPCRLCGRSGRRKRRNSRSQADAAVPPAPAYALATDETRAFSDGIPKVPLPRLLSALTRKPRTSRLPSHRRGDRRDEVR